jgi:UDP:flavonoid glycosyltransferase YjiC (YdhE family)
MPPSSQTDVDRRRPVQYRILFTTLPYVSHFLALVPLARAAQDAGHDVRFATNAGFSDVVTREGFSCISVGFAGFKAVREEMATRDMTPQSGAMAFYLLMASRATGDIIASFEDWAPDVVVRDPLEFAGCLAAEFAGIPHAVGREGPFWAPEVRRALLGPALDEIRAQLGLPADPDAEMPYRFLAFAFTAPEMLGADDYVPGVMHFIQPSPADSLRSDGSDDYALPEGPLVYATLGTVFNASNSELLQAMARALADEPYGALLTIGSQSDLSSFAWTKSTPNLSVRQYVPQSTVLPSCDVVLAHGGFHTVVGALLHGVPLVLLPLGGDHSRNADRCASIGAARVLVRSDRGVPTIRRAVRQVLNDSSFRDRAVTIQEALEGLPSLARALTLLEELAASRVPLVRSGGAPRL